MSRSWGQNEKIQLCQLLQVVRLMFSKAECLLFRLPRTIAGTVPCGYQKTLIALNFDTQIFDPVSSLCSSGKHPGNINGLSG